MGFSGCFLSQLLIFLDVVVAADSKKSGSDRRGSRSSPSPRKTLADAQ